MSDTPNRPSSPPASGADKASDTSNSAQEATGAQPASQHTVPAPVPVLPAPQFIGAFRVLEKLGQGGMGAVYLAEDPKLRRKVAIKTMRPELANARDRERFEREARAAAALDSDHIVPILHVGEAADGTPFIVMPLLQGESLDARLRREPAAPLDLILKVAREVAEGLAAAHAKGLVHRDIKPANIWLECEPKGPVRRCKVLDFGLVHTADGEEQLTDPGAVMGTLWYMAPEQARGKPVDHRTDLFSLGSTLYRMATGALPFTGEDRMAILFAITTEVPRPVRDLAPALPPALVDLIDRLMCKDPAGRPRSAAEVAEAVRRIEANLSTPVAGPTPPVTVPADLSPSAPRVLPSGLEETTAPDSAPRAPVPPERAAGPSTLGWVAWVGAAALIALLMVPLGLWLTGAFDSKKPDPDAAKKEEPPKKERPKSDDPDREAAVWVLAAGGSVRVDNDYSSVTTVPSLPKEPFRLTDINLSKRPQVVDADFAVFAECRHLMTIEIFECPIGDAALAHFAESRFLKYLALTWLPNVTDAGLVAFKNCRNITGLNLIGSPVTDAALVHFKGCANLTLITLAKTRVTDAGLEHLHTYRDLTTLNLADTRVSDTGLAHLAGCKNLVFLNVERTRVTAGRVAAFAKEHPRCRIFWDGGVIPAASDADRTAAEGVLAAGGSVQIDGEPTEIKAAKDLPKGPFRLTAIYLTTPPKGSDPKAFTDLNSLTVLSLVGGGITNAGLKVFAGNPNVTTLDLSGAKVDDDAVDTIKRFAKLTDLSVIGTKLTAAGVNEIAKALPGCTVQHDGGTINPK